MATLRAALTTLLEGDGTLAALVPGGWHAYGEINRNDSTFVDATGNLKVCGVLTMSTDVKEFPGIDSMDVSRQWFNLWFYVDHKKGFAGVDAALARAVTLLDGNRVSITTGSVYEINYADSVQDFFEDPLKANAGSARFFMPMKRS